MDQQDEGSDNESEAYLGDDDGNVGPQDQEVADLDGAEAGVASTAEPLVMSVCADSNRYVYQTADMKAIPRRVKTKAKAKLKLQTMQCIASRSTKVQLTHVGRLRHESKLTPECCLQMLSLQLPGTQLKLTWLHQVVVMTSPIYGGYALHVKNHANELQITLYRSRSHAHLVAAISRLFVGAT